MISQKHSSKPLQPHPHLHPQLVQNSPSIRGQECFEVKKKKKKNPVDYKRSTWTQKPEDARKQTKCWKSGWPEQQQYRVLSSAESEELTSTTPITAREPNSRGAGRGKEKVKPERSRMSLGANDMKSCHLESSQKWPASARPFALLTSLYLQ